MRVFRLELGTPDQLAMGTLASFSVELFGQLSLHGCHLRRRDDGEFFYLPPWAGASSKGRPRVHIHGGKLRRAITHGAAAAYLATLEAHASGVRAGQHRSSGGWIAVDRPEGDGGFDPAAARAANRVGSHAEIFSAAAENSHQKRRTITHEDAQVIEITTVITVTQHERKPRAGFSSDAD